MKPYVVHLKNQFPGGRVESSENHVDAYDAQGNLRVSVRKNGAGAIMDASSETGALDAFSLDPIPKNARVFKLHLDGRVGLSEEATSRKVDAKKLAIAGKVLSLEEYKAKGYLIDAQGNVSVPSQSPQSQA